MDPLDLNLRCCCHFNHSPFTLLEWMEGCLKIRYLKVLQGGLLSYLREETWFKSFLWVLQAPLECFPQFRMAHVCLLQLWVTLVHLLGLCAIPVRLLAICLPTICHHPICLPAVYHLPICLIAVCPPPVFLVA